MLSGIRIYTSDPIWHQILGDFGATVLAQPGPGGVNFDGLGICDTISALELKRIILNASDSDRILHSVFGRDVSLSRLQSQIVVLLSQSSGMTMGGLKNALGYAPDVATHSIDTAIYQLRKMYGRTFIKNSNGVYRLGEL